MPTKIVTVIGARPQFIKAACVSRVLAARPQFQEVLIHTGQHFDTNMSEIFFEQMEIPRPHHNLGVGGGTHGAMTGKQLEKIEEVLMKERPDFVLVYGDTNSTLAGALAAAKMHIPIAHVEAGLRSFNRRMPEEINRVVTDHVSTLLFAPGDLARQNLLGEGISDQTIFVVGDVMYDAALFYKNRAVRPDWFDRSGLQEGEYILCTIHRAENADDSHRLRSIFEGLAKCGFPVILPLHPRTLGRIRECNIQIAGNILVSEPVGYLEMVWLEMHCRLIATDSGGVQKEAYFHEKPCVTLRDETEWVELVDAGWNLISSPADAGWSDALDAVLRVKERKQVDYGGGTAAERIVNILGRPANCYDSIGRADYPDYSGKKQMKFSE